MVEKNHTVGFESTPSRVLHLEVTRDDSKIKICAFEMMKDEQITIRDYEQVHAPMAVINAQCNDLVSTLNEANRRGRMSPEILSRIREIGQVIHDELFPHAVKEKLKNTGAEYLRLILDDRLIHIPWELLNDGDQFLCQKFCMGRLVKTGQKIPGIRYRKLTPPLSMMVLADPERNLKGAYQEGTTIRDYMDKHSNRISVVLHAGNVTVDTIKEKIRNFDIIHFAGHLEYSQQKQKESGWRLSSGLLKAEDIVKMAGTANMPSLVFSNACQSARTKEWLLANDFQDEICTLANAFLLGGVRHYMGTFWEIPDKPSIVFALTFYQNLLAGMPIGRAVRDTRTTMIREFGEETIVWASYLLYGDPAVGYFDRTRMEEPQPYRWTHINPNTETRSGEEEIIDFAESSKIGHKTKKRLIWTAVGAALLISALLVAIFSIAKTFDKTILLQENTHPGASNKNTAKSHPHQKNHNNLLAQADALFLQGALEDAKSLYRKIVQTKGLTDIEMADAMMMLGRIASIENRGSQALEYYSQASVLTPQIEAAHLSKAILLERAGEYGKALAAIKIAQSLSPDSQSIKALCTEISEKSALARDKEKQERISRLIKHLTESPNSESPTGKAEHFGEPTIWVMEFESSGFGFIEGEEKLVATGILSRLSEKSSARFVERSLLDKLLEELKIGTSTLTEKGIMLSVGRMMAAQFIISGRIVHTPKSTMVSCRLINTETTQVKAALSKTFKNPVSPDQIAANLSPILQTKINAVVPGAQP
jgi:CHAT domain-containing protein/tetratricopeptide (TPR) repeat protein